MPPGGILLVLLPIAVPVSLFKLIWKPGREIWKSRNVIVLGHKTTLVSWNWRQNLALRLLSTQCQNRLLSMSWINHFELLIASLSHLPKCSEPSPDIWMFPPSALHMKLKTSSRALGIHCVAGHRSLCFFLIILLLLGFQTWHWLFQALIKCLTIILANVSHTPLVRVQFYFLQPRRCLGCWTIRQVSLSLQRRNSMTSVCKAVKWVWALYIAVHRIITKLIY